MNAAPPIHHAGHCSRGELASAVAVANIPNASSGATDKPDAEPPPQNRSSTTPSTIAITIVRRNVMSNGLRYGTQGVVVTRSLPS